MLVNFPFVLSIILTAQISRIRVGPVQASFLMQEFEFFKTVSLGIISKPSVLKKTQEEQ